MERWDFDCQNCGKNIGDAYYVDAHWYRCEQDKASFGILEKTYPRTKFVYKNSDVLLEKPEIITPEYLEEVLQEVAKKCKERDQGEKFWNGFGIGILKGGGKGFDIHIFFNKGLISFRDFEKDDEYRQEAGLSEHPISGQGWGRHGYCFCAECAKKLKYACPLCGSKLIIIKAEDHPGGHWGIRGPKGRQPAPMRRML